MSTLYERRVEQEWRLLQLLAAANPGVIEGIQRRGGHGCEILSFKLLKTPALIVASDGVTVQDSHSVMMHFPSFFPSVPLEASLGRPVFHPNVHPGNGFVCLWSRSSPGNTVVEGVFQLQRVVTWQLVNEESDHLMQPAALAWLKDPARATALPLASGLIRKPEGYDVERTYGKLPEGVRRRLS